MLTKFVDFGCFSRMEIGSAYALQVCLLQIPAMVAFSAFYDPQRFGEAVDTFTYVFLFLKPSFSHQPKADLDALLFTLVGSSSLNTTSSSSRSPSSSALTLTLRLGQTTIEVPF
jgi:hypothetical protein